jgi:hypothetical protein
MKTSSKIGLSSTIDEPIRGAVMRSEVVVQGFTTAGRDGATRSEGLRFGVVILLAGVVAAAGCVAALLTLSGGAAERATAARHGLESLPLAAQGPVSAALGRDEPAYRVTALQAVNPAQRLRAGFSRGGVTVVSGKARLGMALSAYGYASALQPVGSAAPRAGANRVSYTYAGLTAWYANGPLGLEQGFTVAHAPAGDAVGPLAVSLALSGNVHPKLAEDGHGLILLRGGHTALRYAALRASDARGHVLRSWLQLVRGHVLIRVADRGATYPLRIDPLIQQGGKLTGSGQTGGGYFGYSVALSADGSTALIGGDQDNGGMGSAWVFTRSGSTWTQQGGKLTGTGEVGPGAFGTSVALSANGDTALIGGWSDDEWDGAAWVFTRSGSTWSQQGPKLTSNNGFGEFGWSVSLSADGSTALVAAPRDNNDVGAVWVFTRSGETWSQGAKLTGSGASGGTYYFGKSVALSADGNTALIGGSDDDDSSIGAAWVFTRSGETWTQQGSQLTGAGETGDGSFGESVALSGNGSTALIGGPQDNNWQGAAWVFTRSGETWTQQGPKLTGKEESAQGNFGTSVALSEDGSTALIGAGLIDGIGTSEAAAWVFTRSGATWAQQGAKLTGAGEVGEGHFGLGVALSANGNTALIGGPWDNRSAGAAWVFTRSGETWSQDGEKLTGSGQTGNGEFGYSVALSADGNTAVVGGPEDDDWIGSAWVFTRSGETWTQQGSKLIGDCANDCANEGTGETGDGRFGESVALSADGDTALIGAPRDGSSGAVWVFTRSGSTWTQQGGKLTGKEGGGFFGDDVALSADGNTALIGAPSGVGAAYVFTRSGETWAQQGAKLTGTGETGKGSFGTGVALSADGDTALIGRPCDYIEAENCLAAAWVFTRSGETWAQQGAKLTGTGETAESRFGESVALSGDGNTALIGDPNESERHGAAWVFTRSGETWTQQGSKLTAGDSEYGEFGASVALSGNGDTALIGEPWDNGIAGAAWLFTRSGETWARQGSKLTGAGEIGLGKFGSSVAISGDGATMLIGGPSDNGAGAVWPYVFMQISLPPELSFGSQTTGQPGPVLWLPVQNTGPVPLTLSGAAQIDGTDAGDFMIPSGDDLCENITLAPEQVCSIGVQFTAAENGSRNATLSLDAGNGYAPTVSLTGTGVAASSGPAGGNETKGETGSTGTAGSQGSGGPTVPTGSTGPAGKEGPAGKVEIVTCTKKRGKQMCTTKLVSGPVKFTATASAVRATLSRRGRVLATGTVRTVDGHIEFLASNSRVELPHGRCTLTISRKAGRHTIAIRQAITIT